VDNMAKMLKLSELERRVTALDHVPYYGCGFHYAAHEELARLRRMMTSLPEPDDMMNFVRRCVIEVYLEGRERDTRRAELSAARGGLDDGEA
jgi:hypothetical protein